MRNFFRTLGIIVTVLAVTLWWNFFAKRVDVLVLSPDSILMQENANEIPALVSILKNMDTLWALDFLPDGTLIFTERGGKVFSLVAPKGLVGHAMPSMLAEFSDVASVGEGGLLGIALHPQFSENNFIYFYYTYSKSGELFNRVIRVKKSGDELVEKKIIVDAIPGAEVHNGGRIKFGPDGMLYITTGDAALSAYAQDIGSLAGKILRINDDGTIPESNPFPGSAVYSYGHRNPQGLAWDSEGNLWATEHGASASDEINRIVLGKNYGWPTIRGTQKSAGMESPVLESGSSTWAPSGNAVFGDSLFFTGLRGQALYEFDIKTRTFKTHFKGQFGRVRDVVRGPDNFLYLLTSTRDGRGVPMKGDDQILRINPWKL